MRDLNNLTKVVYTTLYSPLAQNLTPTVLQRRTNFTIRTPFNVSQIKKRNPTIASQVQHNVNKLFATKFQHQQLGPVVVSTSRQAAVPCCRVTSSSPPSLPCGWLSTTPLPAAGTLARNRADNINHTFSFNVSLTL